MTYHWTVPLLAALLNTALAAVVLRHNPRSPLNRVFGLLSLTLISWNLNIFVLYFVDDAALAWQWSNVFRVGTLMAASVGAHLFVLLSESKSRLMWASLGLAYALSGSLIILNAGGALVTGLRHYEWGFYPIGTRLYVLVPVSVAYSLSLAVGVLFQILRKSEAPRRRQQARLFFAGLVVAGPLGMTNLVAAFGLPLYPLGNMANVAYAVVIAYGILRYRLMDIDVVITKSVSYALVGALLIIPAFGLSIVMQRRVFGRIDYDFSFALLVLLVLVGVLFPRLRSRTETSIERSFFREKHEYRVALLAFTRTIIRILERGTLVQELSTTLSATLRPDRVAIFLRDDRHGRFELKHATGIPPAEPGFAVQHPLIAYLEQRGEPVLRDEVGDDSTPGRERPIAEVFTSNGWEVCVPLPVSQRLIGFLGLGRKHDLDVFSIVDLDLLGTLAAQAAIAFENARLSEELHRSRDLIQRAGRMSALGTLAAGIAHEIRNPLVSIQTFFQLAPQRLHEEEFVTSFLGLAENEVKRIADLVSELLSFARSHTESIQEIDLDDTIDRTIRLLAPQAHRQRVQLQRREGKVPLVKADPDRVKQVLINIILNAIQATPEGGTVEVATRTVEQAGREFCQVEVRDTGAGIPVEMREDIFNPFFTTKDKGTGLGLSIANQIVAEHGGFITVESESGRGSRFFIHLPISVVDPETAEVPRPRLAVGRT